MAVIRVNKTKDYTVMSNNHFREKGMSLKAKGLLSLMLSLPDDWGYSITGLTALAKDGKDSVMSALSEIEKFGYLKRTKLLDEKGRFSGYAYDIYEYPQTDKTKMGQPNTGKPYAEKPNTENPPQLNTNQSNTKKSNTKDIKKESKKDSFNQIIADYVKKFTEPEKSEIADLLGEWLKARKAKRAAMTDRAIQMNIDKLDTLASKSNMTVAEYLREIICRGWAAFYAISDYSMKRNANTGKTYGENGIAISNEPSELDDLF